TRDVRAHQRCRPDVRGHEGTADVARRRPETARVLPTQLTMPAVPQSPRKLAWGRPPARTWTYRQIRGARPSGPDHCGQLPPIRTPLVYSGGLPSSLAAGGSVGGRGRPGAPG